MCIARAHVDVDEHVHIVVHHPLKWHAAPQVVQLDTIHVSIKRVQDFILLLSCVCAVLATKYT